jgi:hypothetical protein
MPDSRAVVLPEPVCPYASTVRLKPINVCLIIAGRPVSLNTSSWVTFGPEGEGEGEGEGGGVGGGEDEGGVEG